MLAFNVMLFRITDEISEQVNKPLKLMRSSKVQSKFGRNIPKVVYDICVTIARISLINLS